MASVPLAPKCYNIPMNLQADIETVKGVGPKTAAALRQAGIQTVGDLLYLLPRTYENYQTATDIAHLRPGKVMVKGKISNFKTTRAFKRRLTITEGIIRDATGAIRTLWFNQAYRERQFDPQREYYFSGTYEFRRGRYQLISPTAVLAADVDAQPAGLQPLYSTRSGLKPAFFRKLITSLRSQFTTIPDLLPLTPGHPDFLYPGARAEALFAAHFPTTDADSQTARRYLAYEELFELILASKLNREANQRLKATPLPFRADFTRALVSSLPFQLTAAQRRAAWEIFQDLGRDLPMNRLLQGDVGSGKTVVAALAAAQAALYGHQAALLAPTAILATQHYESLSKLFASLHSGSPQPSTNSSADSTTQSSTNSAAPRVPRLALLTSATKHKAALKAQIAAGEIDLVIGTHALLTDDTQFHSLALCIIDEQHRFGVAQRQKLLLKSPADTAPHLLAMTATPIPRSLQLTVFGDLDSSVLNQLPAGRQPITTHLLPETEQKDQLYPAMRTLLATGQQIYWICPAIDAQTAPVEGPASSGTAKTSPKSATKVNSTSSSAAKYPAKAPSAPSAAKPLTSVKRQAKKLAELFPDYRVGLLHGKLSPAEKDQVMSDFAAGRTHILVSTTVVEVGVNVPNANMIIIQDAEHYGLAQLHQLRGRVGRGDQPASCYLLTTGDQPPSRRLRELTKSTDGFYLAEVDLKLRGPGEIYGSLQHGALNLQFAALSDRRLVTAASHHAGEFARTPDQLSAYPELAARIKKYQQLTTLN